MDADARAKELARRKEEAKRKRRKKKRTGSSLVSSCFQGEITLVECCLSKKWKPMIVGEELSGFANGWVLGSVIRRDERALGKKLRLVVGF